MGKTPASIITLLTADIYCGMENYDTQICIDFHDGGNRTCTIKLLKSLSDK